MMPLGVFVGLCLLASGEDFLAEGLKALDAHEVPQAESLFRQAVEADPPDYTPRFNLALALSLENKGTEAIAELRKTLELKPDLYQAS